MDASYTEASYIDVDDSIVHRWWWSHHNWMMTIDDGRWMMTASLFILMTASYVYDDVIHPDDHIVRGWWCYSSWLLHCMLMMMLFILRTASYAVVIHPDDCIVRWWWYSSLWLHRTQIMILMDYIRCGWNFVTNQRANRQADSRSTMCILYTLAPQKMLNSCW